MAKFGIFLNCSMSPGLNYPERIDLGGKEEQDIHWF